MNIWIEAAYNMLAMVVLVSLFMGVLNILGKLLTHYLDYREDKKNKNQHHKQLHRQRG